MLYTPWGTLRALVAAATLKKKLDVVVRADGSATVVEMINPQTMVDITDNPDMGAVADQVTGHLQPALDTASCK